MTIKLSDKQAKVIIQALDTYSRLYAGQIKVALDNIHRFKYDDLQEIEDKIKDLMGLDLTSGTYYGIANSEIDEKAKIAYDILQVLRHDIAWRENPKGGMGTHFSRPIKFSKEEDLIEIVEEKK